MKKLKLTEAQYKACQAELKKESLLESVEKTKGGHDVRNLILEGDVIKGEYKSVYNKWHLTEWDASGVPLISSNKYEEIIHSLVIKENFELQEEPTNLSGYERAEFLPEEVQLLKSKGFINTGRETYFYIERDGYQLAHISKFTNGQEFKFVSQLSQQLSKKLGIDGNQMFDDINSAGSFLYQCLTKAKQGGLVNETSKGGADNIYFGTFSGAVQHARATTEAKGYALDENDWDREITFGRGKPSVGQTISVIIGLTLNDKPQKKALAIQVYGMDSGKYELNFYVS